MSLLAPEFMVLMAYDQLTSARQSVRDMKKSGRGPPTWTLTHAYYTDMGGFLLHEPEGSLAFPVSAKQLRYLVDHQYLQMPDMSESQIWDKSKADKFAKAIVLIQTIWFLTETVARAVQHLPITPIEIETLAVICVTLVTFGLWYNKPKDVEESIDVCLEVSVAEILRRAGDAANLPFRDTPLDFAEPPFHISSIWNDDLLRWILRRGLQTRPLDRMPNDNNPRHNTLLGHVAMVFILVVFVGLPFANWNFAFPTRSELILWRVNIVVVTATLAVHFMTEERNAGLSKPYFRDGEDYKQNWLKSLMFLIPGGVNFLARLCLVSLCLSSLRQLPSEAFVTVQWTSFIPHI